MAEVKEEDLRLIKEWRRPSIGLLVDVNKDTLKGICDKGLIAVFCGDGDRSPDFCDHLMRKMGCNYRPHLHAMDGGALRLAREAPIPKKFRINRQFVNELLFSRTAKKIPTLILCVHYPCGMAEESHIDLRSTVYYCLRAAKTMADRGWHKKRIVPLFHVFDGEKERTYFIEKKKSHLIFT